MFSLTRLHLLPALRMLLKPVGQHNLLPTVEEAIESNGRRFQSIDAVAFMAELLFIERRPVFGNVFQKSHHLRPLRLLYVILEKFDDGIPAILDNGPDGKSRPRMKNLSENHVNR